MRILDPAPAYPVPLSDDQLQELGLFCAVWSQIDMLITILLAHLCQANSVDVIAMTAAATTAPRITMVERVSKRLLKDEAVATPTEPAKHRAALLEKLRKTCKELHAIAESRNHLMHGFWASMSPPVNGETVGSYYDRYRDKPIMVGTLPSLTDRTARLSSELSSIHQGLEMVRQGLAP